MRSTPELLELPYSFWQLRPLNETQFLAALKERGLYINERILHGLHRLGILVPFFRYKRNGREIAAAVRRGDSDVWEQAFWIPSDSYGLRAVNGEGALFDPAGEGFTARRRLDRKVGDVSYLAWEFLYSHHQLLAVPMLRLAVPHLSYGPDGEVDGGRVHKITLSQWRESEAHLHGLAIALTALEPLHYPDVIGRISYNGDQLSEYERWARELNPSALIEWLGVDAKWLRAEGERLLSEAELIDPMGEWAKLIGEANPRSWEKLGGEARSAVDLRIAAEIFLRHYEDLSEVGLAPALPEPEGRWSDPYRYRLRAKGSIDGLLTDFGISPHPRLVLVVEGDTEQLLLPRVMAQFSVSTDREYIAIENARGVGSDLSSLISFAISPRTDDERREGSNTLRLVRPPTRLLVVMDAEGRYISAEARSREERKLIDRIMLTFPREHQTPAVRAAIEGLVKIETWDRAEQSFEFAHFTDRQLASAIGRAFRGRRRQGEKARIETVAKLRRCHGNLEDVLGAASKVDLAEELWPLLERKITAAKERGTERRIPVVRVLAQALEIAHAYPRQNVVIDLEGKG